MVARTQQLKPVRRSWKVSAQDCEVLACARTPLLNFRTLPLSVKSVSSIVTTHGAFNFEAHCDLPHGSEHMQTVEIGSAPVALDHTLQAS